MHTILGALHRAKRITTNWQEEVQAIKQSFIPSGYPAKFVNEVINDFENPTARDDETIIPVHWFDERTKSVSNYHFVGDMNLKVGNS